MARGQRKLVEVGQNGFKRVAAGASAEALGVGPCVGLVVQNKATPPESILAHYDTWPAKDANKLRDAITGLGAASQLTATLYGAVLPLAGEKDHEKGRKERLAERQRWAKSLAAWGLTVREMWSNEPAGIDIKIGPAGDVKAE